MVHSLAPERDLKHGDLRLKLINHAMDPKGLRKEVIEPKGGCRGREPGGPGFGSEFEEIVYKGLTEAGYRVVLRCTVGAYVVDLVVEGEGRRIAIQCDGDRKQLEEELPDLMHRQLTLERLGWKFIRLRSSEFFRDTDAGLKKLFGRLKEAGIEAIGPVTTDAPDTEKPEELKKKVLKRAEMIRTRWQDIPAPPEARPVVGADAEEEAGEEEDEESREAA
ncbi:MAG: DUF559 domain-containing protein [Planctomycetota bacterium]